MAANTVRAMREKMLQVSDDALYKEGNGQLTAKERAKRVLRMCKPGHDEYQNLMKPITSSDLQMIAAKTLECLGKVTSTSLSLLRKKRSSSALEEEDWSIFLEDTTEFINSI